MLRITRAPCEACHRLDYYFRVLVRRIGQLVKYIIGWVLWIIYSIIDWFRNSLKWWAGVWMGTLIVMFIVYFALITYSPSFRNATGWLGGRAIDGSSSLSVIIFGK